VPLTTTNNTEIASQFTAFTRNLLGMPDDGKVKAETELRRVFMGIF